MAEKFTATSSTTINAGPEEIWNVLTDPDTVSKAFFGAKVDTDWRAGSPITWTGEWQGRAFRDHGEIKRVEPGRSLVMTHFSPLSGQPDVPENYHVVSFDLRPAGSGTEVTINQTNAGSVEEKQHSEANWDQLLSTVKEMAEG
jgi:uncharacterized protein YndB with AHSA1/START domain